MATAGVFTLITNDGKQDRMLMATALLSQRLAQIEQQRAADPMIADKTPTLLDIEKTHVLFMNAHFKPFAAIGFEYNKVNTSGAVSYGASNVTFSIPQFGDFFHDMVLHALMAAPTITRTDTINSTTTAHNNAPAFRWCHYPGERLLQLCQFNVNGNPLDEYTYHAYNFHREFCIPTNKLEAWNRCVGQENATEGWVRQPGVDMTLATTAATAIASSGFGPVSHRVGRRVFNGPQTPKLTANSVEVFVPLLFWFNRDPRLAIPSVAIPYGQRYITLTLATSAQMYGLVPRGSGTWATPRGSITDATTPFSTFELYINNIFVNPEVHSIFIKRVGFSLIRVHRQHTAITSNASDQVLLNSLKWPTEYLYVAMKPNTYASTSSGDVSWYQDRWHLMCQVVPTAYDDGESLSAGSLARITGTAAVATTGVVTLGTATTTPAIGDVLMVGGFMSVIDTVDTTTQVTLTTAPQVAVANSDPGATAQIIRKAKVEVYLRDRMVDTLTVTAHGIPLYNNIRAPFYSDYLPLQYGPNINGPSDIGAMFVNFSLFPGSYQPSGHINISRAREFYISWTSTSTYITVGSIISSSNQGLLVCVSSAINFLLISDGSAVLRYST